LVGDIVQAQRQPKNEQSGCQQSWQQPGRWRQGGQISIMGGTILLGGRDISHV
jgi:hypothetical protein